MEDLIIRQIDPWDDSQVAVLELHTISDEKEVGLFINEGESCAGIYINESQAKQIVEHFKEQFGWDK